MLTVKVQFLFDFGSPNAYLAHTQMSGIEARTGAQVEYVPALLGGIFKATGNQSPAETFADVPAKRAYEREDMGRYVARFGVPYTPNPFFPVNTLQIMRGRLRVWIPTGSHPMWRRFIERCGWKRKRWVSRPLSPKSLTPTGLTRTASLKKYSGRTKARLIELTNQAVERGVFGSPSFFVGDEQFFGKDRLNWFEAAINTVGNPDGNPIGNPVGNPIGNPVGKTFG